MSVPAASPEQQILESWRQNAQPWTRAVRNHEIASRTRVTNKAIVDTVLEYAPASLLDVGCGEGWLVRELAGRGVEARGVDGVPSLIESACTAGGNFEALPYADLASAAGRLAADVVVCNFSLLGEQSTEQVLGAVPQLIGANGHFIVQTLHPWTACGEGSYQDGWRVGSWDGFSGDFSNPAPWYFRTLEGWLRLFSRFSLQPVACHEPIDAQTGRPASILFVAIRG